MAGSERGDEHEFFCMIWKLDFSVLVEGASELLGHFASKSVFHEINGFMVDDAILCNALGLRI